MIEININELGKIYDPSGKFYICCETPRQFVWFDNYSMCPVLSPKIELSRQLRNGLVSSDEFMKLYRSQLRSPAARAFVSYVESQTIPMYLVTDTNLLTATLNIL